MLIDLNEDDNKHDTIYFNNDVHNLSDSSTFPSRHYREEETWNCYPFKPVAQQCWEDRVAVAAAEAAKVENEPPGLTEDLRPRVYDYNARDWLLLDSGAAVSCYPHTAFPGAALDTTKRLQAVNGAEIKTFGTRWIKLKFGAKTYNHPFILAAIPEAVAGWDLILKYKLDLV